MSTPLISQMASYTAKNNAKRLKDFLASQGIEKPLSFAQEATAASFGIKDFNTLKACLKELDAQVKPSYINAFKYSVYDRIEIAQSAATQFMEVDGEGLHGVFKHGLRENNLEGWAEFFLHAAKKKYNVVFAYPELMESACKLSSTIVGQSQYNRDTPLYRIQQRLEELELSLEDLYAHVNHNEGCDTRLKKMVDTGGETLTSEDYVLINELLNASAEWLEHGYNSDEKHINDLIIDALTAN
ncbi:hypothetical protein [Neptuniibacter sp. QD37_11]|uniref:hypothetical protein n=1 Tax=Neptuniibacter sp. QD37_11 TaxID=3398209 RepID=UPI0039F541F0